MILLTCALPLEAKPIITFFQLKQICSSPFSIWENDYMRLIISGVGKNLSAAASAYLFGISDEKKVKGFLNIGLAGHNNFPIGSMAIAQKIMDKTSQKTFYPSFVFDITIPSFDLMTVDQVEKEYRSSCLYDMEAFGFYEAASCFFPIDLIYSIKIISDNAEKTCDSPEELSDLFKPHLPVIQSFIHQMIDFSSQFTNDDFVIPSFFTEHWKFTHAEKHLLKELLTKLDNLHPNIHWDKEEFKNHQNAKDVLQYLEKKLKILPFTFF